MFNTTAGRIAVYTGIVAFDVACWYGIITLILKVV